ncbi:MAG: phospholipid carrier-dependent glycosyltransferase [Proteobacteria bacterium]|nr:phospholipid carrier-dependent glycosyltransferase [Pseudomonadota bacterium]
MLKILNSKRTIGWILGIHFVLWLAMGLVIDVHPDTADHWVWSRHPALGYVVHPPAVAYTMKLATLVGGDSVATLKVGAVLFSVVILFLAYQTGLVFFGRKAATLFVLLLEATPYFSLGSVFWHIDQPYMAAWLAGLWGLGKYTRTGNSKWLFLFGICAGIGALSKYITLLFYISLFFWCLFDRRQRHLFARWQTYATCLISLLVFSPNLYWNATNNWASFRHQLGRGTLSGGSLMGRLPEMTAGHLVLFSIVFSVWAWKVLFSDRIARKPLDTGESLLVSTALTPLVFFSLSSLRATVIDPHWLNVGYFSLFLLFADYLVGRLENGKKRAVQVGFAFQFSFNGVLLIFVIVQYAFLMLPPNNKFVKDLMGWEETADGIEALLIGDRRTYPKFVISREYQLSGALSLYLPFQPLSHSIENPRRNQWSPVPEVNRHGAVLVCPVGECKGTLPDAMERFDNSLYLLGESKSHASGRLIRHLKVYLLPGIETDEEIRNRYIRRYRTRLDAIIAEMEEKPSAGTEKLEALLNDLQYGKKGGWLDPVIKRGLKTVTRKHIESRKIAKAFYWFDRWLLFDEKDLTAHFESIKLMNRTDLIQADFDIFPTPPDEYLKKTISCIRNPPESTDTRGGFPDGASYESIASHDGTDPNRKTVVDMTRLFVHFRNYLRTNPGYHWQIFWKTGELFSKPGNTCVLTSWKADNILYFPVELTTSNKRFRIDPPNRSVLAIGSPTLIVRNENDAKRIPLRDRYLKKHNMLQARNGILRTTGEEDPFFYWKNFSPAWFRRPSTVSFEAGIFPEFFLRITNGQARMVAKQLQETVTETDAQLFRKLWSEWRLKHHTSFLKFGAPRISWPDSSRPATSETGRAPVDMKGEFVDEALIFEMKIRVDSAIPYLKILFPEEPGLVYQIDKLELDTDTKRLRLNPNNAFSGFHRLAGMADRRFEVTGANPYLKANLPSGTTTVKSVHIGGKIEKTGSSAR